MEEWENLWGSSIIPENFKILGVLNNHNGKSVLFLNKDSLFLGINQQLTLLHQFSGASILGSMTSDKKKISSKMNAKKGGWPKGVPRKKVNDIE